jgi:primase-polymerase (primpol)-like protein
VPLNHCTGRRASSTDPQTWGTFQEAYSCYQTRKLDGIGFMLGDGFAGVDWDDVVDPETGGLDDLASEDVAALDTYCEISPSGTGVKAVLQGTKPGGACTATRGGKKIEVNDHARYFALTGSKLPNSPASPEPRQRELADLYNRLFRCNGAAAKPPTVNGHASEQPDAGNAPTAPPNTVAADADDLSDLEKFNEGYCPKIRNPTDEQIIEMAVTGVDKLSRLWAGDLSEYDGDHSRADEALCVILAFLTQDNPEPMDRLFQLSGVMRPKWNEKRGQRT